MLNFTLSIYLSLRLGWTTLWMAFFLGSLFMCHWFFIWHFRILPLWQLALYKVWAKNRPCLLIAVCLLIRMPQIITTVWRSECSAQNSLGQFSPPYPENVRPIHHPNILCVDNSAWTFYPGHILHGQLTVYVPASGASEPIDCMSAACCVKQVCVCVSVCLCFCLLAQNWQTTH